MGISQKILPHYTYEDYKHWEGKWELIDGFPIAMSPSPVPRHQMIAAALKLEIGIALKKCSNCRVYDPVDYLISDDTILQPDVLVLCKMPTKKFLDFTPSLVAEILSPSTALRDRNTKYDLYESQGVNYYLIVDIEKEKIEIYQLQKGKYKLATPDSDKSFEFNFEKGCVVSVNLQDIWVK